jgi:hypothetical protein
LCIVYEEGIISLRIKDNNCIASITKGEC